MTKSAIGLCSFISGVCFALLPSGDRPRPLYAQAVSGIDLNANGLPAPAIGLDSNAIPVVHPLDPRAMMANIGVLNTLDQQLDGLQCEGCTFSDAGLTYGGGAFDLKNVSIAGNTHVKFTGAAANTLALLNLLSGISFDKVEPSPRQGIDIEKSALAKKPLKKLTYKAPFVGGTFIGGKER